MLATTSWVGWSTNFNLSRLKSSKLDDPIINWVVVHIEEIQKGGKSHISPNWFVEVLLVQKFHLGQMHFFFDNNSLNKCTHFFRDSKKLIKFVESNQYLTVGFFSEIFGFWAHISRFMETKYLNKLIIVDVEALQGPFGQIWTFWTTSY